MDDGWTEGMDGWMMDGWMEDGWRMDGWMGRIKHDIEHIKNMQNIF